MLRYALCIKPPVNLKTVGGDPGVELVYHTAIFVAFIGIANRAETGNVEIGVSAEEGVVSPGHQVKTLLARHLPLRFFESKTDIFAAVLGVNAHLI